MNQQANENIISLTLELRNFIEAIDKKIVKENNVLRKYKMTTAKIGMLSIIAKYPKGITVTVLAKEFFSTGANVSYLIKQLLQSKLITRDSGVSDGRQTVIILTDKGQKMLDVFHENVNLSSFLDFYKNITKRHK